MRIEKRLKLDQNALLVWTYDDENFLRQDYKIVDETLREKTFFTNTDNGDKNTFNLTTSNLFELDPATRKWGIVDDDPDTNQYQFLQFQEYPGNVAVRYDTVRIYFPTNYNFGSNLGFLFNVGLINNDRNKFYNLSNYYFDKSDPNRAVSDMQFASQPLLFNEQIWGKFIELQIPAPFGVISSVQRNQNGTLSVVPGSIQDNLVDNGDYLAQNGPIYLKYRFLTAKNDQLGQISFTTTPPFETTIPATPEFEDVSVRIEKADDGDYFNIYGTYKDSQSEFENFIDRSRKEGRSYQITYQVTQFEKNMQTGRLDFFQDSNFDQEINYRPIIKFSTTTAIIDVQMNLFDVISETTITRRASYVMNQEEVARYARFLSKLNVRDAFKPKVYNQKPSQILFNGSLEQSNNEIVEKPFAVMFERFNIMTKNISETVNDTTYYGLGLQQIMLYPSDNVIKFQVASGTDETGIIPFQFDEATPVNLVFKSDDEVVEIPTFNGNSATEQTDLTQGILIYRIPETKFQTIKTIFTKGFDQFYLIYKTNVGINTIVYSGRFLIFNQQF